MSHDETFDPDARSPQLGIKYSDLLILEALRNAGADFSQERHVVHYLYFPTEASARAAAGEVAPHGWSTDVYQLEDSDGSWSLKCQQRTVLDLDLVRDSTDLFDAVAARHAGEYDGWEASV